MKTFQDFSPYNGLQWEPDSSRSKRELITVSDAVLRSDSSEEALGSHCHF